MNGLEDQLGRMGTAFASSLLGLAGSLVVGLLELYAGGGGPRHGQNRFYRELEEWLASITRVSFASGEGEGGGLGQIDHSRPCSTIWSTRWRRCNRSSRNQRRRRAESRGAGSCSWPVRSRG